MYNEIQKLKSMGLSRSRTANKLQINFRTVSRYWDMSPGDYAVTFKDRSRNSIRIYPALRFMTCSTKSIRLLHRSRNAPCATTLPGCRNSTRFHAKVPSAAYEAVQELPDAEQVQVDMGSLTLGRHNGGKVKVYCFAMVLSHSRYKYAFWQDHPFTTTEFVAARQKAFSFFGGRPRRLAYDQDRVMTVSENHGDILFTEGFRIYADALHFQGLSEQRR